MTSTHSKMFDNNVTIIKYLSTDGEYKFKVLDKFNEQDEVKRLEKMMNIQYTNEVASALLYKNIACL